MGEDGGEYVRRRLEEFGASVSEMSQMLAKGLITGFLPFFIKVFSQKPGGGSYLEGWSLFAVSLIVISLVIWGMRVYWYSRRSVLFFVVGGLATSSIASVYLRSLFYLGVFVLSLFISYAVSWGEVYFRFREAHSPSSSNSP